MTNKKTKYLNLKLNIPRLSNSINELKLNIPISPLSPLSPASSIVKTMSQFYENEDKEIISYSDLLNQLKRKFNEAKLTDEFDYIWHNQQIKYEQYNKIMGSVTRSISSEKNKICPICLRRPNQI